MINLGTGPNMIIGFIASLTSIALYVTRIFRPSISKDQDILLMTIGLIYSSILIIHGWRLDPILIFSQILLVSTSMLLGYDNFKLRSITVRNKKLKNKKQTFRQKIPSHSSISRVHNITDKPNYILDLLFEYRDFEDNNNIYSDLEI